MEDGGVFEVADVRLEVICAPGHTPGSVCLYCEDLGAVFTGHVMLAGGPAPHDGEYPDFAGQLNAIGEYLLPLPADTRVLPGQGPETTIAMAEKNFDSWVGFLQGRVGIAFEGIYKLDDLRRQNDLEWGAAPVPVLGSRPAVWVGGRQPLRGLYARLLERRHQAPVHTLDEDTAETASALGAVAVAKRYREIAEGP